MMKRSEPVGRLGCNGATWVRRQKHQTSQATFLPPTAHALSLRAGAHDANTHVHRTCFAQRRSSAWTAPRRPHGQAQEAPPLTKNTRESASLERCHPQGFGPAACASMVHGGQGPSRANRGASQAPPRGCSDKWQTSENREMANFFTWPFEALIGRVGGSDEVCRSSGTDVFTPEEVRGRGAW
jgi:hypothetical protein